jgi:hypothetical protein
MSRRMLRTKYSKLVMNPVKVYRIQYTGIHEDEPRVIQISLPGSYPYTKTSVVDPDPNSAFYLNADPNPYPYPGSQIIAGPNPLH